jgi:serine/threonine protein kinase
MDTGKTCFNCFKEIESGDFPCPHCGFEAPQIQNPPNHLRCGSVLSGKYLVGRSLGQGGFGITYVGWDLNLDLKVAIKEFYPEGFASREQTMYSTVIPHTGRNGDFFTHGRDKFVEEAKTLAKFTDLPGVVNVRDYFAANGTAYIVMEFLEGRTLKDILRERGKIPAQEVLGMLDPVFSSLEKVHSAGLLHRDISPDNIILTSAGIAKLLDFGAARQFSTQGEKSNTVNVKHGFAPEEQYRTRGEQGPWTDIYALCATIYALHRGLAAASGPRPAGGRGAHPPNFLGAGFTESQQAALMRGLSVKGSERQQTVGQLIQ